MYCFRASQKLNTSLGQAWDFISAPLNLELISPPSVQMRVLGQVKAADRIYKGQVIEHRLRHITGVNIKWVSLISEVKTQEFFVDEQSFGPFKSWCHQHILKAEGDGVIMEDIIHYSIPFGFIGRLANSLFVRRKLEKVFEYRRMVFNSLFGKQNQ